MRIDDEKTKNNQTYTRRNFEHCDGKILIEKKYFKNARKSSHFIKSLTNSSELTIKTKKKIHCVF